MTGINVTSKIIIFLIPQHDTCLDSYWYFTHLITNRVIMLHAAKLSDYILCGSRPNAIMHQVTLNSNLIIVYHFIGIFGVLQGVDGYASGSPDGQAI